MQRCAALTVGPPSGTSLAREAAAIALAAIITACAPAVDPVPEATPKGGLVVQSFGLRPTWDLDAMVKRSDAVVIGALTSELAVKRQPGGNEDPPRFHYLFKDFELTVDRSLHPRSGLPTPIAVLVEAGFAANAASIAIAGNDTPEFLLDERVLLFLESQEEVRFAQGVGRPVPAGFAKEAYYQAIIGARFGKLSLAGDK